MPTPNVVVRLAPELREPAEARAKAEHRTLTEVIRSALRQYLTGDDGGEALTHAVHRAEAAEAELERTRAALAAARAQRNAVRATDAERQAKASLRAGQEARLTAALEAATREDPATAPRLAVLSGYGKFWCRDLARALAETGYLERTGPGQWIAVPGKDISEAMPAAKRLAQSRSRHDRP